MLTSRTEKELYGEWQRQREEALKDSSGFPASGQEYSLEDLNVGIEGLGINDPETYLIDSQPVDSESEAKADAIDIRKLRGHD